MLSIGLLDAPVKVRSTIMAETEFTKDPGGTGTVLMRAVQERWEAGSVCRADRLPFLALMHVRGGESLLRSRGVVQRLRPGAVVALGGDHDHAFACHKTQATYVRIGTGEYSQYASADQEIECQDTDLPSLCLKSCKPQADSSLAVPKGVLNSKPVGIVAYLIAPARNNPTDNANESGNRIDEQCRAWNKRDHGEQSEPQLVVTPEYDGYQNDNPN